MTLRKDIADKLRAARKEAELTQTEVGKKMHCKQQCVALIESGGGNLTLDTIEGFTKAVKKTVVIELK